MGNFAIQDTYNFVTANQTPLTTEEEKEYITYLLLLDMLYLGNTFKVVNYQPASSSNYNGNNKYYYDVSKTESVDTWIAARFYDGQYLDVNDRFINWQNIKIDEYEKDLFNYMIYKLLFANSKYYGDPELSNTIFSDEQENKYWGIRLMQ